MFHGNPNRPTAAEVSAEEMSRHLFGALRSPASGSCTGHASNLGYPKLDGLFKKLQDI